MSNLSLKQRFGIVFAGFLAVTIAFCSLLIWEQHRTVIHGADLAIQAQAEMVSAARLREALVHLERAAREGEFPSGEVARFADLSRAALANQPEETASVLRDRFGAYVDALRRDPRGTSVRPASEYYEQVLASVNAISDGNEARTYHLAEKLKADRRGSIRASIAFLFAFIVLLTIAGYKIISVIVRPLSSLVRFLDQVNVEDDLPSSIPHVDSKFAEVQHVSRSFEQLLGRLRGYRALNVGRLLIEKRRAEVIAASITDGVFLLRGEEILYVNPVGERILSVRIGRGFSLTQRQDLPGACAILSAASRTMPVEFTLDEGDRKTFYLIQTYPIPKSVIEQAEHAVGSPMDEVLDRFQADTIVVAQDVTLVRESEEAKRHFLGTLSHEVRTPVTSLTMATRLLKRDLERIENPTHRALIKTCIDDVERLRGLVEDLVTVSRFETLTQRMDMRSVDLAKLVRHSVQAFQFEAKERGVELSCRVLPQGLPSQIPVDATKISWAVSNLMTNALRHTPRGGHIEAELEAVNGQVEFRVRDNGPGIDRKRQSRIFDKFNPHYDLRVARSGSAGMGLAIAREIVVAHGGRIWVSSEPGQGALFAFTLPLAKAEKRAIAAAEAAGSEAEKPRPAEAERVAPTSGLRSQLESMKGAMRGTPISGG